MRELILTKGKVALVDEEDYERVSKYKWSYNNNGYGVRGARINGKRYTIYLHREIMNVDPNDTETYVDHINEIRLDCRKSNLRLATRAQNRWHSGKTKRNSTGYKGVTFNKRDKLFIAQIMVNRKSHYLGCYSTAEEAGRAYREAASRLQGEFCYE